MKTGENIERLRKQHNLKQYELAERIGPGVYQQTVSKWQNNLAAPTYEQARKMATLFQVPISEICDEYSDDPKQIIPDDGLPIITKNVVIDYLDWDQKQGNQSIRTMLISLLCFALGLFVCELAKYGIPGVIVLPIYILLMIIAIRLIKKVGLKKESTAFSSIETGVFHLDEEADKMVRNRKDQIQMSAQATSNMGTFGMLLLLMWIIDSAFDAGWEFTNAMLIVYIVGFGLVIALCMPTMNYWNAIRRLLHESCPQIPTPLSRAFWKK